MQARGYNVVAGMNIIFIVGEGTGVIRDRAMLPEEIKDNKYDSGYYLNNQIIPAVEGILAIFGYDKSEILHGKKQSKLDSYFS